MKAQIYTPSLWEREQEREIERERIIILNCFGNVNVYFPCQ